MDEHEFGNSRPRWISITGQPLDLGLDDPGFKGTKPQMPLMSLFDPVAGQCASIGSYEKLNQLGEGSKEGRPCILSTVVLTVPSLRRRVPSSRPSNLSSRRLETSTDISRRAAKRCPNHRITRDLDFTVTEAQKCH